MFLTNPIKMMARRLGLHVIRERNIPFGVEWLLDVRWCLENKSPRIAFDIGANTGQTALAIAREFPNCKVWSFEPVPSTYDILCKNIRRFTNIKSVRCGLGSSSRSAMITSSPLGQRNRILNNFIKSADRTLEVSEVEILSIADFVASNNIDNIDLLKIDTEGYEIEVLEGASNLLKEKKIGVILAECEFIANPEEPHGNFFDLYEFMRRFGYTLVAFYSAGVDHNGWRWGNALFCASHAQKVRRLCMSPRDVQ
ncbi:MAG: FkbM family methyltransferase [Candidatus Hydrogenedentes bacterium]|nr:FkbM family methyltransferase [Candidatus Hydrogenedentota bacterium]